MKENDIDYTEMVARIEEEKKGKEFQDTLKNWCVSEITDLVITPRR